MSEERSFEELLKEESSVTIHNGAIVEGTVISVNENEIILNIRYKADGILTKSEYSNNPDVDLTKEVKVDDKLTVKVLKVNDGEGQVLLTYKRLQQDKMNKVFEEAMQLVNDYMKTKAYDDFLVKCIRKAERFAGDDPVVIYINPSDEKKRTELEKETGAKLTVSAEDFIGGVRAVIRSRNILMDHSFKTQIQDEYDKFLFLGGDGIA